MDIFDRIRMLAKSKNVSLSALEKELGFSNKSLYPHKKDSTIRGDRVVALANYFGVTTDYLLTGKSAIHNEYDPEEWDLLNLFHMLNDDGRYALKDYAEYLARKAVYRKKYNNDNEVEKAE